MQEQRTFTDKLKAFFKELGLFLSSMFFLKNFAAMIGAFVFFLLTTFWWMRCYTKHGESLQVHDYTEMELEDAIKKAESRGFEIVVSDSVFIMDREQNIVLSQNPKPLSRAKEDRSIYLTVTKKIPPKRFLPNLIGSDDFNRYTKKLKMLHLKPRVKERVFDNKYEENTILYLVVDGKKVTAQDLKDKIAVPEGSVVEMVVTERGGTMVQIPDLVCMQFSEAEFLLSGMQLNLGTINADGTVTNQSSAYVWRQIPAATGKKMRMGEQVEIFLTQYRPEDCNSGDAF
ncbi:MAG: PASTA domain-containing protein [Saprospiraceae bacterium]